MLLLFCTVLTIFLQVVFVDIFLSYNYTIQKFFFSNTAILYGNPILLIFLQHIMLPPPFALSTEKRQNRSLIQDVTPFLNSIIFQYSNPLPFETEPHTIHTIPLAREHRDSYLYYI